MDLIDSCREIGFIGVVLYTCIFIAWSVFLLPQTPIEIAAGLIWKPLLKAVIIAWVAKVLGSCVCFFIGRHLGGRFVEDKLGETESKYVKAIGFVLEQKTNFITALVSCAFIPAAIKNYALGTLPVPFKVYLFWTSLCGLPYSFANVMIGAAAKSLNDETAVESLVIDDIVVLDDEIVGEVDVIADQTNNQSDVKLALGLTVTVITVIGIAFLGRFCKKELEKHMQLDDLDEIELDHGKMVRTPKKPKLKQTDAEEGGQMQTPPGIDRTITPTTTPSVSPSPTSSCTTTSKNDDEVTVNLIDKSSSAEPSPRLPLPQPVVTGKIRSSSVQPI